MRRLSCNQVSLILTGIVLHIIASEFYHEADCFEIQKLKIDGIVEPLLNKFKNNNVGGCFLSKIGKSIGSCLSEKTLRFLGSFANTKEDKIDKSGDGITSHTESSTEVNHKEDNNLFFDSEEEPPKEEEIVGSSPQQKSDSKNSSEYSDPFHISVLKGLKIMLTIPIKIVHPKPSKKPQELDDDYDYEHYEPLT